MKNQLLLLAIGLCLSTTLKSQYNDSHLNIGLGVSSWGIPVYVGYDFPILEDVNLVAWGSFQSRTERYGIFNGSDYKYRHTIIGFGASGQYYFDSLIELPEQFDVYAGLGLGFYIWETKYISSGSEVPYSGNGNGGVGIIGFAGARYYLNNRIALNLELKGGNVLSGGHFGVSFKM